MYQFLKLYRNKTVILMLVILQHVLFITYVKHFNIGDDWIAQLAIVINIIFIYIASIIRGNHDNILCHIIMIISVTIWQYLLILNTNSFFNFFGLILQPLVMYFYTVETLNLLFYRKVEFKKKFDFIAQMLTLFTMGSIFLNRVLFNFSFLLLIIFLHLYPVIVLILYRKYLQDVLNKIKYMCVIFAIFLLVLLISIFVIDTIYQNNIAPNLGWYINITIISFISYLRVVRDSAFLKIHGIAKKVALYSFLIISAICILWFMFLSNFVSGIKILFIVINGNILFVFLIVVYIIFNLNYQYYKSGMNREDYRLSKLIYNDELVKQSTANYLHDEVLQSIIAIKNLVSIQKQQSLPETQKYITEELNNLIINIRDEMDTLNPILEKEASLKESYEDLITTMLTKYKTNKKINFNCPDNFVLYAPYDNLVYRILKELINNALKHTSGYEIFLSLNVKFDIITIDIENQSDFSQNNEVKRGRGLSKICKDINVLGGEMCIKCDDVFSLKITLPMKVSICYENFID